jgi:hypothetical protein
VVDCRASMAEEVVVRPTKDAIANWFEVIVNL